MSAINFPLVPDGARDGHEAAAMRSLAESLGGLPPQDIVRIVADVAAALAPLHAAWRAHGAIAPDAVRLDAQGRAHLTAAPAAPAANAPTAERAAGYAAFEQYTDDPQSPCGPWTDVYGLAALAYALATGEAPAPALRRCVRDDLVPLSRRMSDPSAAAFARGVDAGLAMDYRARPATLAAFLEGLRAPMTSHANDVAPVVAVAPASEAALADAGAAQVAAASPPAAAVQAGSQQAVHAAPPSASAPLPAAPARVSLLTMLAVLAAGACAVYVWWRAQSPPVDTDTLARPDAGARAVVQGAAPSGPGQGAQGTQGGMAGTGASPGTAGGAGANAGVADAGTAGAAPAGAAPAGTDSAGTDSAGAPALGADVDAATARSDEVSPAIAGPGVTPGASPAAAGVDAPSASVGGGAASLAQPGVPGASAAPPAATPPAATPPASDPASGAATADPKAAPPAAGESALATVPPAEKPKPQPVGVTLDIRPWGEVLVDGRSRGVSPPLKRLSLPPGKYAVTVRNPAMPDYQVTLDVAEGRPAAISHSFQ